MTESDKHASLLRLGINYHGKKSYSCGPALSGVSQDSDFVAAIKPGANTISHYGFVIYRKIERFSSKLASFLLSFTNALS